ncbi:hypothetical protein ABEB36_014956 [Hypothenemus hampei]|uniref:THAP-type domain-containing protein n=1 Tax=Hypothenemus hampei TaxID=57062 RepID=A0ABD1E1N1_HYPHA
MVSCACGVSKSDQSKSNGITFHVFPRSRIRQEWIDFVNKPNWIPKAASYLCSKHFTTDCFDRTSVMVVRLKKYSLPTIEDPDARRGYVT